MIKKLISGFLAAVMLSSSLPLGVLAEAAVYEKHFVIEPVSKLSEKPFREWAAELVRTYRNEYACVNKSGEFLQSAYDSYEKSGDQWIEESSMLDDALYHPYYALAEAKEKYNLSKDANAQHDGEIIKSTEYTLLDEQELKGLYLWMIKETIMEKAQMDPGFFEQEVEGNQRLYSFSVSEGALVMDSMLENLEQSTVKQAWADVGETAVSALEVAIETAIAWDQLNSQAKGIVDKAKSEASGKEDYSEFINSLKKNVYSELGKALTDTLDTAVKTTSTNFQKSIQNIMRAELTSELLDNMMDCNINIVNYLKTTYVETPVYLLDKDFADTVDAVIDVLESPQFEMAMISTAEEKASPDLVNKLMSRVGLELNEILSEGEIKCIIAAEIVANLLEGICSVEVSTIKDGLKEVSDEWKEGKSERAKQLIDTGVATINGATAEAYNRCSAMIAQVIRYAGQPDLDIQKLCEEIEKAFGEQFLGLNNKKQPILDSIVDGTVDTVISAFVSLLGIEQKKGKDPIASEESVRDLILEMRMDNPLGIISELGLDKNEAVAKAVCETVMILVKGLNQSIQDSIDAHSVGISASTKVRVKATITDIDKTISEYEKMLSNNKDVSDVSGIINGLLQIFADMIELVLTMDENESQILWRAIWNHPTLSLETLVDTLGVVLKDVDYGDILFAAFFGGRVSDVEEGIINAQDENILTDTLPGTLDGSIIRLKDKLESSLNSAIEDVTGVLGSVWDSMMDCSADLAKAANSVCANLSGEHSASLNAERARQTYKQSKKLEAQNVLFTRGGRIAAYMNYGIDDYERFLDIWNNDPKEKQNRYLMDDVDIVYHDPYWNWPLTPDVDAVRVLTDYILTQMHLDAVGMGAYVTVVANREEFETSYLYEKYLNKGILLTEDETKRRYNMIVEMIREIESEKPALN